MFIAILQIIISIFVLFSDGTITNNNDKNCSISKLGCNCQNIEIITNISVESCCKEKLKTLLITGPEVKNISIDIRDSPCSSIFVNLFIRDTGIISFNSPFYGLGNISSIYIEKNQNLSNFNKLIFSEVSQTIDLISVEQNAIRTITSKTFSNLTSLGNLKLSDNKIGYIEENSFSNLTNLTTLYLNNNLLTVLNTDVFFGLGKLKILSLLNNFLLEFKPNVFRHLKNLQFLQLSLSATSGFSGFDQLPDNMFFDVKRLKHLNMTLKIKNLTSLTFYGLFDLERLDLQGNQLTVISLGSLQQMPKVLTINLSRNQIRCLLPDTFSSLPRLKYLDLSNNDLSFISNEVLRDLQALQTLDLTENNIYVIEKNAFVGLKSLLVLKLNIIHGKAKNELQNNPLGSPMAKLRNTTKIIGLSDYFGISRGSNEPAEIIATAKPIVSMSDSKKLICPVAGSSDKDWVDSSQAGSRKYLLIIVGICVVFLLIAFAIIMSYRAWSKRKMSDSSLNVEFYEKQEMLENKSNVVNGRIDSKSHSKSSFTRKSLNGSYMPDVSVDKGDTKTDSFINNQTQQPNLQASTKPTTCPLSKERNHSDDESALTPLGVL